MSDNVFVEEAQRLLLERTLIREIEHVRLQDSAGRVLAEDILAGENVPGFACSRMDGYAVSSSDVVQARKDCPVALRVIEKVPAGHLPQKAVRPGTAIKVMTGAPIPEGADAVIKFEDVVLQGEYACIFNPVRPKKNIISVGEDLVKGEVVSKRGTVITPVHFNVMSVLGLDILPVFARPKVAVIATGDELVDKHEPLRPGKIRNSNLYSLEAFIKHTGGVALPLGNTPDNIEVLADKVLHGLDSADMIITTGGASTGDYDVVKSTMDLLGAKPLFISVDMRPGKGTAAFIKDDKLIISLSGNPAANMVSFQLFVVPVLKKMLGYHRVLPSEVTAILGESFSKFNKYREFLPGRFYAKNGVLSVLFGGTGKSSIMQSMIGCHVLADIPAGSGPLAQGTPISTKIIGRIEDLNE
ncbi:MAG: molybdopterin molybdotransferase MoeA [Clostridia bacterium]|nr:molybdopterin molybdotransferase MoeA [Clostridia bacterium]